MSLTSRGLDLDLAAVKADPAARSSNDVSLHILRRAFQAER
ncbi:hypothetical protein QA649_35980 [Bradyrhizobium sp. CB1717]|nr:hypothetical protein [Bradyrhizobium sp. CB1717]WFU23388.1 hypothetical protein QA649_35980 [Bradyrhizobium sp. CB1717]